MSRIKVISLDVFGTLIYPRIPISVSYSQFAWEACQLHLPPKNVEKKFFIAYNDMCVKYPNFGHFDGISSRSWWNKVISQTYAQCLDRPDFVVPLKATDRLYDWYGTSDAWGIYPHTFAALRAFRALHVQLAALSNFDERLPHLLEKLCLSRFFQNIVYSSILPYWKPDPRIFEHICQMFVVQPNELLHVGDSFEKDYLAARAVGSNALLIQPESETTTGFRDCVQAGRIEREHLMNSLDAVAAYLQDKLKSSEGENGIS